MNTKLTISTICVSLIAITSNAQEKVHQTRSTAKSTLDQNHFQPVFTPLSSTPSGKHRYFIRLINDPAALYSGGVKGYSAIIKKQNNGQRKKLNVNSPRVKAYRNYLMDQQRKTISTAKSLLGDLDVKQQTTLAFNGMVVEITQEEAIRLSKIEGVANIQLEKIRYPTTDAGPRLIKAPSVWSGEATGISSQGEGKVIGIIDSGINTDNPSFASLGGDGYQHINPLGKGNYLGDCKVNFPELCNDKLIGVFSWPLLTDLYVERDVTIPANGEDHNGHGSHTASTAAGNVLNDVSLLNVDGEPSGIAFNQISGVAPHANIVSYQVCLPGERDRFNFGGCFTSLTVLAVENAIENGIDAINYSIGGGASDPWNDPDSLAFLAARRAGINVATSAGNSGPEPETVGSPGDAPWLTSVAAYTHDRRFSDKELTGFSGGDSTPPNSLTGSSVSAGFTGKIVYAGDFQTSDLTPEQCLTPFPAGTFQSGTIVVCDRGAIARVDKGRNVKAGGAEGLVLANLQGGAPSVNADYHVLPSIHINANDGDALKAWLATGSDHMATITGTDITYLNDVNGNFIPAAAQFTSRGPNLFVPNVIAPSVAAPGVNVFAAYADNQSNRFKENPDPSDFAFLSGTSMASPHVAGALTLISSIHPTWTPAEVQSALMLTANQSTTKDDGSTPSDFFDMGAGFIDIESASKTGLVLEASYESYVLADPNYGGKPDKINSATMANASCVDTCSWTRTVTATKTANWTATPIASDGLLLTITPESFTLNAGESQSLTITANTLAADEGWNFANIQLTGQNSPKLKMPIAVKAEGNNLPNTLQLDAPRRAGSITHDGYIIKNQNDFSIKFYDKSSSVLSAPLTTSLQESGSQTFTVVIENPLSNAQFIVKSTSSPDVDIELFDVDDNSLGSSAGADSNEVINISNLNAGTYKFKVTNFQASSPGASDDIELDVTSILFNDSSVNTALTASVTESDENDSFSLTFNWNTQGNLQGFLAVLDTNGALIKAIPLTLLRTSDVSFISPFEDDMKPGVSHFAGFEIEGNPTSEDRIYQLIAELPSGQEITNINNGGQLNGSVINWTIRKQGGSLNSLRVGFDFTPRKSGNLYGANLIHLRNNDPVIQQYRFSVLEGMPTLVVNAPSSVSENSDVVISTEGTDDPNGDKLSYAWKQLMGSNVSFTSNSPNITFKAPNFTGNNDALKFEITVDDNHGDVVSKTVDIQVTKVHSSGGALSWFLLLLWPLGLLHRRKNKLDNA